MARKRRPATTKTDPAETLTAEALTIAWLLAVFTALVCELGAVACFAFGGESLQVFGGLLLFSALVIGLAAIGAGLVASRYRQVRPPRGILVFSWTVGLLPIAIILIQSLR